MTTPDFIMARFDAVDQESLEVPQPPEATLSPSEGLTLALLWALPGGGRRALYRWLTRNYQPLCPQGPERTRVARLCKPPTAWTARCMAAPTVWGVADSSGMELMPPLRAGRSPAQIGTKGQRHPRWLVGGTLGFILHPWGVICTWDGAPAHGHDTPFQ